MIRTVRCTDTGPEMSVVLLLWRDPRGASPPSQWREGRPEQALTILRAGCPSKDTEGAKRQYVLSKLWC